MEMLSTFQRFMQSLLKNLKLPVTSNIGPQIDISTTGHVFEIEVIESQTDNVVFCVRLGISPDTLSSSDLFKLFTHNQPQKIMPSNIVGLSPQGDDFCLWCCASIENLQISSCVDMLNQLIYQAEELRNFFEAPAAHSINCPINP